MRPPLAAVATAALLFAPAAEAAPPEITIDPKGDHEVAIDGDTAIIDVRSKRGIGRTALNAKDGKWPAKVMLRFHLKGLEKLEISNGGNSLITSVSSTSRPRRQGPTTYLTEGAGPGRQNLENQIPLDHPLSLKVKPVPEKGAKVEIPLKGYFEIELPADFLKDKPASLKLHWIDFYRG